MTRDTSLDEFLGGGETVESEDADGEATAADEDATGDGSAGEDAVADDVTEADTDDEDATRSEPDADAVEPAVITYDVTPDGAECAACRDVVTRRWRDDPGMVCGECKDW